MSVVRTVRRIISGRSVGKIIIIILNLGFYTSKNKNIDHRGIENCTYESDYISLLRDSTIPSALNICFDLFYCNLKEKDHITRKIDSKKKNVCL